MKPPESFVPLTAAPVPPGPREFRVSILNGHNCAAGPANGANGANGVSNASGLNGNGAAKAPAGFQSLEAARPVSAGAASVEKKIGEPHVTVQRDGDRITHLRIQCTCGMVMDLACVYDAQATK